MNSEEKGLTPHESMLIGIMHITPEGLAQLKEAARREAAKELKKYSNHYCPCEICRKHY